MSDRDLCLTIESVAGRRGSNGLDEIWRCVESGANLNGDGIYHVPLIAAVRFKRPDIVRLLIELGADPLGSLDDLISVTISKSIKCLWPILEHIKDTKTRIRAMKELLGTSAYYEKMAWNHRVSRTETLIEFVRRGFLDVNAYCGNPPSYYPSWGYIPRLVQELIIARKRGQPWSSSRIYGPMVDLILFSASERFFPDALERTIKLFPMRDYNILLDPTMPKCYREWLNKAHMGWTVGRHYWFTPLFRRMVRTVMLCWYRLGTTPETRIKGNVLPRIPLEMWWMVLYWCRRF